MRPLEFNYHSLRAEQARLAHHIAHPQIYWALAAAGVVLVVIGVGLAWLDLPFGWFIAGLSGLCWTAAGYSASLQTIPVRQPMQRLDDMLDAEVLGMLPAQHSPKQLAAIVMHLPGGRFFALRLGVGSQFLAGVTSDAPADSALVWHEAQALATRHGAQTIGAAELTAALIRTVPNVDALLAHVGSSSQDVLDVLAWYNQVQAIQRAYRHQHHQGGVGRDWAFGYTPLLEQFGSNISQHNDAPLQDDLPSRQMALKQLLYVLSQGGRRNAALVGGLGAGKTTLVHTLARRMMAGDTTVPSNLRFWQVVALDPATLIAHAGQRGQIEQLVQALCLEAYHAKNIVLFLDNAELFFEDANGAVNIANVLLPILDGGALPLVLAMDEQRWLRIAQSNPALAQHLNRISLALADQDETMRIMQNQFVIYEYQHKVAYTLQALQAAYQLSSRYLSEQVMPGRALSLLESAAVQAQDGLVTRQSVEQAIERTQGVKVSTANTDAERDTLLHLEDLIHRRMINQTRAVQVVSDALRRARAGVRNQNRPIGTFLFLGPTGVGKTELAKSVAAVFFGGEEQVVRLDLNEYSRPEDVSRLIAPGAQDSRSLTAQIAKNPFSVVLFDEIEKAHPAVLNTLLQMLDEGILRDSTNREVSFRDAVVIATSNAGAERIRQHIDAGQQLQDFETTFVDELISSNIFRPEFLNRFDEIVLFRPLTPQELMQVIDLILQGLNTTLASQKVSVAVDEEAKQLLVQAGYDPRLGARPLRRVVQRVVENIVSKQLLAGQVAPGSQIHISAEAVQVMLGGERSSTSPPPAPRPYPSAAPASASSTQDITGESPKPPQ